MAKDKNATATSTATNNATVDPFEIHSGDAPEPVKQTRSGSGMAAAVRKLQVNEWLYIPRKEGKADHSKRAGVVRAAKAANIAVTIYQADADRDVVKRVS